MISAQKEKDSFYLKILDNIPNPIWRSGKDAKCDFFNKAWLKFTGRTIKQEMGDGWVSGVHPDDLKNCVKDYLSAFKARKAFKLEYRLKHHDGTYHWLVDFGNPVYSDKKEFLGYIGSCYDINQEKEYHQKNQESEAKFQALTSGTKDAIVMMDNQGKIFFWNKAAEEMFGYKEKEVIGKDLHGLITAQKEHRTEKGNLNKFFQTGKSAVLGKIIELPVKRKNGEIFSIELMVSATSLDNKWYGVGIMRDITERKKMEEDLKFKNMILSTQHETSMDGILVVDENNKIISFNKKFVNIWSISPEIIESRSDERAIESVLDKLVDPDQFISKVKYLYSHKNEISQDELLLKSGVILDRYSAPILGKNNQYYGRVWYFRDITERKHSEEKLKEKMDEMEKMNRLMVGRELKMVELKEKIKQLDGQPLITVDVEKSLPEQFEEGIILEESVIAKLEDTYITEINKSSLSNASKKEAILLIQTLTDGSKKHEGLLKKLVDKKNAK